MSVSAKSPEFDPRIRGRGAPTNPAGRFELESRAISDDGWRDYREEEPSFKTEVTFETPKSIITNNKSPDVPFDRSINPYRGCEHGCIYCFARPSHSYMDLSPGLDFETRLFAKPNAAQLLEAELAKKPYSCRPIALGTNTDPYQPLERTQKITQSVLQILAQYHHPFTITTKSELVLREIELLAEMAQKRLTAVGISVTSLDHKLSRRMEPRASSPKRRLAAIETLSRAGIPVVLQLAPMIPAINDMEMEQIMHSARNAGATQAVFMPVRLPFEVSQLFREWLDVNYPDRASKVMKLIGSMRDGKDNDPRFHERMKGKGPYAQLLHQRFKKLSRNLGFAARKYDLDCSQFIKPGIDPNQMDLF
jgi:DNA repair photolyase